MKTVTASFPGRTKKVKFDPDTHDNLLEALEDAGFELLADCGGCCSCATCHVELTQFHPAPELQRFEDEQMMLDEQGVNVNPRSRLACQVKYDQVCERHAGDTWVTPAQQSLVDEED